MTNRSRNSANKNMKEFDSTRRTNKSTISKNSDHYENSSNNYYNENKRNGKVSYGHNLGDTP
jgi:hypothetical protein